MTLGNRIDVPLVLRHAHDEVLLSLAAETKADALAHRERADAYMRTAVFTLSNDPIGDYDWSELKPDF